MKKLLVLLTTLFTVVFSRAQYPTIGQTVVPGLGIGGGLTTGGANLGDAALHIKADPNPNYNTGGSQNFIFCETTTAPGDYFKIINSTGSTNTLFSPFLVGSVRTQNNLTGLHLGANIITANDVVNTIPAMLYSVRRDFTQNTSTAVGNNGTPIVNRPLFQWNNAATTLMTMYPTTLGNGDARLAFGLSTTPTYKFEIATPMANDGIRITNTGNSSAVVRLRGSLTTSFFGAHEWSLQSSGSGSFGGGGNLNFYDYTTSLFRFFIKGQTGNIGIGDNNTLTTNPQFRFDINTPYADDGIRVTQTGTGTAAKAAMLSLVGGGTVGTAAGQARRWSLFSTGGASAQGAGHLLFSDFTTNVERMRIHENGFVGINTVNTTGSAPTHLFHVKSNGNTDPVRIQSLNTANDSSIVTVDNLGVLHTRTIASLGTGGISNGCTTVGQVPVVNSATGNLGCSQITDNGTFVGIATTTPSAKLHVLSPAGFSGPSLSLERNDGTNQTNRLDIIISTNGVTGAPSLAPGTINFASRNLTPVAQPDMAFSANNVNQQIVLKNNGNVGINQTSPLHRLHVHDGALMLSGAVPGFGGPQLLFSDNLTTNPNGRWAIEYMTANATRPSMGGLHFWTPSPGGNAGNYSLFLKDDGKIGMGVNDDASIYPGSNPFNGNYRLYVKGGILTDKVKVAVYNTSNWADYVFASDYKLKSLEEVEAFTKANKHLPGVKSAEEMVKDGGIDVNEMFAKQMEKIEELTLYLIEMKKEIKALKSENEVLKTTVANAKN